MPIQHVATAIVIASKMPWAGCRVTRIAVAAGPTSRLKINRVPTVGTVIAAVTASSAEKAIPSERTGTARARAFRADRSEEQGPVEKDQHERAACAE